MQELSYHAPLVLYRYHLLPAGDVPGSPEALVVSSVSCSGHLLVVSAGDVSMHSIASLVLPFRCVGGGGMEEGVGVC
jgi:hypothetical protein